MGERMCLEIVRTVGILLFILLCAFVVHVLRLPRETVPGWLRVISKVLLVLGLLLCIGFAVGLVAGVIHYFHIGETETARKMLIAAVVYVAADVYLTVRGIRLLRN